MEYELYAGKLLFCYLTEPKHPYDGKINGPQSQRFTQIGEMPDGRKIGVVCVLPETLTIVKASHPEEYICQSWNELLTHVELTPHIAWFVRLTDGTLKLERDLEDGDAVQRTASDRHKFRVPPFFPTADFNPDYIPPVGTTRVYRVEGEMDQEHVVLTGPDNAPRWYIRATGVEVLD